MSDACSERIGQRNVGRKRKPIDEFGGCAHAEEWIRSSETEEWFLSSLNCWKEIVKISSLQGPVGSHLQKEDLA